MESSPCGEMMRKSMIKVAMIFLLPVMLCTCSKEIYYKKNTGLYSWLLGGASKTKKYDPEKIKWKKPKCRGCKYDPSIWL